MRLRRFAQERRLAEYAAMTAAALAKEYLNFVDAEERWIPQSACG